MGKVKVSESFYSLSENSTLKNELLENEKNTKAVDIYIVR